MADKPSISDTLPEEEELAQEYDTDTTEPESADTTDEPETGGEEEDDWEADETAEDSDNITDGDEDMDEQLNGIKEILAEAQETLDEVKAMRESIGKIRETHSVDDVDLSDYRKQMKAWKKQGYNVERLESVLNTGMSELVGKIFDAYSRDVNRLEEIEKSLDALDTTGFRKKDSEIRENLKDPDNIALTLKHLIELEIEIRRKMEMNV